LLNTFILLLSRFLLFLSRESGQSSLFSLSGVFNVGSGHVEGLVDGAFLHVLGDFGGFDLGGGVDDSHDFSLGVLLDIAGLAFLDDDDLLLVFLQSGDVSLEVFGGFVSSSGVHADSDLFGLSSAHTGVLEFFEGKASSDSGLGIVSEGWALDDGSEGTGDWSWGDGGGFGGSR